MEYQTSVKKLQNDSLIPPSQNHLSKTKILDEEIRPKPNYL